MTDLNIGYLVGFVSYPVWKWLTLAVWDKICDSCEPMSIEEDN